MNKLRAAILASFLSLVACGEDTKHTAGPNNEYQCYRTDPNLYMIDFPDGQNRKAEYWDCTDGCALFYYTSDHGIHFRTCDPPPHLL